MLDLVVKNCRVVWPEGIYEASLAVEGGVVVKIARNIEDSADQIYDAKGKLLFPGVIDGHVHLNLKYDGGLYTADDFFTGTAAAACGGVTTVIDFVVPETKDYVDEFRKRRAEADGKVLVDYGLHMCVTSLEDGIIKDLEYLFKEEGICSVKVFTAYSKRGLMLDDGAIKRLMDLCVRNGVLMLAHCENEYMINNLVNSFLSEGKLEPIYHSLSRPDYVEAEAIERIAFLSELTDCETLVVHLSSAMGLEKIRRARSNGVKINAETCPHYLVFTEDVYRRSDGAKFIMSPPLKKEKDRESLWKGLINGDISVVGSDHACFNLNEKMRHKSFVDVPGGVAGTEVIAMVLFSEGVIKRGLGLDRFVEVTALNPSKLYGIYPKKGSIMVGGDADFYILDTSQKIKLSKENLHSNIDHSIYEDLEVSCRVQATFSRGELIAENGEILARAGRGRYLSRKRGRWVS